MKKLKFKDIYNKVNHNPYCQVININKKVTIKSNVKNLFKNYYKTILIAFIIILSILIFVFLDNLVIALCSILLLLFLFIANIFYNTYKITLDEKGVRFKINLQEDIIPYEKLANIYLEQGTFKFFFIPFHNYNISITYLAEKDRFNMYTFPTFMVNKKDILNFFSAIEVEPYKDLDEELEKEKNNKKGIYKALGISLAILFIIILIISIFLYIFRTN